MYFSLLKPMAKIAEHIRELLYCHDCVILPEFGGFIANYSSAKIDEQRKLIHPPSKHILFNKYVKVNDGLLASKIVREERVSYEKAHKQLTKFVNRTRRKINAGERVEIKKVGVLYLDKEENIQFIQDEHNFLTSSFGLPSVDLIPVKKMAVPEPAEQPVIHEPKVIAIKPDLHKVIQKEAPAKEEKVVKFKEKTQSKPAGTVKYKQAQPVAGKPEKDQKKKRSVAFWAAAVIIPLFLIYGVLAGYNGLKGGSGFNTASLNPLTWFSQDSIFNDTSYAEADTSQLPVVHEDPVAEMLIDTVVEVVPPVDTVTEIQEALPESTYVEVPIVENLDTFRYHVIGGCFAKEKYARDFVEDMQQAGFSAHEVDMNKGLHRISLGGTDSRKEARKIRKEARDQGISCWILRL